MSDFYSEKLVKKKPDGRDMAIKVLLILLTVLSVFIAFVFPFGILLVLMMGGLDYMIFRSLDVEYEYQYINGDLDIDKIMHKERRKSMYSANMGDLERLAPAAAGESGTFSRTCDFTSGTNPQAVYEMIISRNGVRERILFEPNEAMVEEIWAQAPRKVVRR